ncbi:sensor histidine kinase [Bacillus timonensis]|uniref:sensor histidine kinase n=1 Tax=Bacillus timonensis TaxID=1033734 RepID=UPI000289EA7B|nr:sensor histidine kinase [Bacillus timonensis]
MKWGIRKKLIFFLMIVTILPFGSAIAITYFQTTKSLNTQFVSTNHTLIENGEKELTNYLESVAELSTLLYRYTPFMSVMRDGISENLSNNQEEVRRAMAYIFNSRPEIEQMHLYIDKEKDSFTNYHSSISGRGKYEDILSHPYYAKLDRNKDLFSVIEPPHEIYSYNGMSFIPDSEKRNVISFHTSIRDIPSNDILGFLSLDINLSKVKVIASRLYTVDKEDFYIMDENNIIIYSSDEEKIGTKNNETWFSQVKKEPEEQKSLKWKDKQFSGVIVYDQFPAPYQKWYIVKRIPFDALYQSARETVWINIVIGIVTLLVVLLATIVVSFKTTRPIKILIENMKKVEKGNFEADFDSLGNDEIGLLGRHFKSMIDRIDKLIEKKYKLEIENKASELRVLRSQINPHFLYNALQSIGTLALKSNAVPVYRLLTSLSTIMRYSMNVKEDIVPFSSEVSHVESYLHLQKQRFEEQFQFELNIQKEVQNVLVPKMILQPIVENCFKHGFDQQIHKCTIQMDAFLQSDDMVCIQIKDNGMGVNEEHLQNIRQGLYQRFTKENQMRETIGLKNIFDRLQIYYDHQAKLLVSSPNENGFIVTIEIPKTMPKGVEQS